MAKNITLMGASYSDVPSILLPQTGGGTAQFYDITDAENALGSDGTETLEDSITALTTYSNEITGASDTTLSAAVATLAAGYGSGDTSVMDAIIDRSITSIDNSTATEVGANAFYSCNSLETVRFTSVTRIETSAFRGCTSLVKAVFPVTTYLNGYSFRGDTSLTTAEFSALTFIGNSAFYGCSALTAVVIRDATSVTTLYSTNAFDGANNAIIYVPDSLVNAFKAANNWSTYASRIKGLSELPS